MSNQLTRKSGKYYVKLAEDQGLRVKHLDDLAVVEARLPNGKPTTLAVPERPLTAMAECNVIEWLLRVGVVLAMLGMVAILLL